MRKTVQTKQVIVAFGDVRGFTSFTRRVMNTPGEKARIILAIYRQFETLGVCGKYHLKYTGDGFMLLMELPSKGAVHSPVHQFLKDVYSVAVWTNAFITRDHPKQRFRVRVTLGEAFKIYVHQYLTSGKFGKNRRRIPIPEFVGYPVSLADRLLEVYADEHLCICHENVSQVLIKEKNGIRLARLLPPEECPNGVDREDIEGLSAFEFDQKNPKED